MGLDLLLLRDPHRDLPKHRLRAFGPLGGDIGRAPDSFWVLPDPKKHVSSRHCVVEFRNEVYWLRDTSLNGVFLNGSTQPVGRGNSVPLRHGDRIRIGKYEMVARLDHAPVRLHGYAEQRRADEISTRTGEHQIGMGGTGEIAPRDADPVDTAVLDRDDDFGEQSEMHAQEEVEAQVESDSADWAASTHPDVSSQAEAVSDESERDESERDGEKDSGARGYVASALSRLQRQGRGSVPPPEAHRFRKEVHGSKVEEPVEPRIYRSTQLDPTVMERHGLLLTVSDEAAIRAYKILRTRLRRRLSANHWRSVGVTGDSQGVGKTLTAINLATALAQDSRAPVFLADLDLYRPQVGAYLGMTFDKGLSDYLLGEAEIEDIIYSPDVAGLAVIPNGRPLQHASELLGSPRMAELVQFLEAEQPNRTILYDLPPILMSDDVLVFSPLMDCVLDVVAVGVTPRASLDRSREILSELNVVGVVLNRATEQDRAGHYYYY